MIRRIAADIRTLDLMDLASFVSIAGFICSAFVVLVIWSGNLP